MVSADTNLFDTKLSKFTSFKLGAILLRRSRINFAADDYYNHDDDDDHYYPCHHTHCRVQLLF